MHLENADWFGFVKSKWYFIDWVALLRHFHFKSLRSQNWLCELLKQQVMNLSEYGPSVGKECLPQLAVHLDCWLMDSWLQKLAICRYRATDHIWSFNVLDEARATSPECYLCFHHSCHWFDMPVSEICQRLAMLTVTADFPGDVLARAAIERPAAASELCWQSESHSDLLINAAQNLFLEASP